ncbi:hypothetical protein Tco_0010826 [Tanacetum coccineum]
MAALESCPKHNMIAYLEKTDGNAEFYEIIYFLTRSSIHYALTVSPVVSTTFVEQFWMYAKSKTINNARYINATVAGKPVTISGASIRSDLLFDDADGIDTLNNQAIFDTIYSKSTSWDQIPTNIATAVICLATNQKYKFSKLIFDGMMRHLDAKKKFVMYPRFISVFLANQLKNVLVLLDHFPINALTSKIFSFMVKKGKHFSGKVTPLFPSMLAQATMDKSEEGSGGNHGGQSSSDRSLSGNEDGLTLQSVYDLYVSLCKQVTTQAKEIKDLKAQIKQLKKKARPVISHHKAWMKSVSMKKRLAGKKSMKKKWMQKESVSKQGRKTTKSKTTTHKDQAFDNLDAMDYMETEDAHNEEKTSSKTEELKTSSKTKELSLSGDTVVLEEKDSVEKEVSTEDQVSTDKPKVCTDQLKVSTDKLDEGTAKPKDGNLDESAAPTTVFRDDETIAEFLIDPKDKGKKVLEEEAVSDAESEEEWEAEEEKKMLAEEEATKAALIRDYDDIRARIEADSILAARLQEEEREKFTIEERAKLLHDTIAAQRRFLAQQRSADIKSRPPTKAPLRNQMMNFLKHVGNFKHADLNRKKFEEIQTLYGRQKKFDQSFISIGFAEDEKLIKDVNKKAAGTKKADSIKEESKEEEGTRKRKLGTRKKMKLRKRRFRQDTSEGDSENENDELRLCLTIAPDEDKEVDYEILDRNNGQRRYFSTLIRVLSIFDREDLNAVYKLVMDRYQDEIPEGFDRVLWGDLMIMFNPSDKDEFWNLQQDWNYHLRKKVLLKMLELKLESEEDSTIALELIKFVKKLIVELEPENSDGDEEDL